MKFAVDYSIAYTRELYFDVYYETSYELPVNREYTKNRVLLDGRHRPALIRVEKVCTFHNCCGICA